MALDFTTGVLDPRVTVTRALDTATAVNSSGFIAIVNANLPRFDYDPATLAPKGLLIEETRTNFVLQSNVITSSADVTVTTGAATSPDGTTNAYRTTKANATDPVYSSKTTSMTVAANTAYTASRFVKYDGFNTTVSLEYNVGANWGNVFWNAQFAVASTGVTVSSQNSCTAAVQNFGNGWYRLTATFTTGGTIVTPSNPSILLRITGGSGVSVLGYGVQLEAGAFATSYIPTTTTSLTRNADQVTMTGTNFSDWYNASEGAFACQFRTLFSGNAPNTAIVLSLDGSSSKRVAYIGSGANSVQSFDGSTIIGSAGVATGSLSKVVSAYNASGRAISTNANTPATGAVSASYSTASSLAIGGYSGGAAAFSGHISSVLFYNLRLINAEIQAFSK
jgi:hypothetical protein